MQVLSIDTWRDRRLINALSNLSLNGTGHEEVRVFNKRCSIFRLYPSQCYSSMACLHNPWADEGAALLLAGAPSSDTK